MKILSPLTKIVVKEFPAYFLYYLKKMSSTTHFPVILMYHSVNDFLRHRLIVHPKLFEKQIQYLLKTGWEIVSLDNLITEIGRTKKNQSKKIVLTFDDGYEDNYSIVFGILKQFEIQASIFLISNFVGSKKIFPWFSDDQLWATSMNWDQVIEMQKYGVEFGSHTRNHPLLSTIKSDEKLLDELVSSKKQLEKKIGTIRYFCYPAGDYTQKAKSLVKSAGYRGAVSVKAGFVKFKTFDQFLLPRIEISGLDNNLSTFSRKITGCYIPFHQVLQRWQQIKK